MAQKKGKTVTAVRKVNKEAVTGGKKKEKEEPVRKAKKSAEMKPAEAPAKPEKNEIVQKIAGALPSFVFQTSSSEGQKPEGDEKGGEANPLERPIEEVAKAVGKVEKTVENLVTGRGRVPTGIPGFDSLIEGGFEREGIILIGGDSGSGKTIFGLQYLYNGMVKYNEPGVYLSFAESKDAVMKHGKRFGWDFEKLEKEKKFAFIRYEPHEVANIVKEGGGLMRDTLEAIGAKRLVVDSVTAYSMFFKTSYEASESLLQLFDLVRNWHCTTMLISEELVALEKSKTDRTEFLADGIIYLYHFRKGDVRTRAVEVLKMRDTIVVEKLCPFRILPDGITVFPDTAIFNELRQF